VEFSVRHASFAACVTLLLIGTGVSGCKSATETDVSRSIYCEVQAEAPQRDNNDAPKHVLAATRFRCEAPGASTLDLTMRLQRQVGAGPWTDVASLSFSAKGSQTVPGKGENFIRRQISTACAPGTYRTRVTGSIKARGSSKSYDITGPRSFDPCHPGVFAK